MLRYIVKRILFMIPVLFGVTLIVFSLMYITPGDPASMLLGDGATAEAIAEKREELGLNDPYAVQLFNYVKGVVTEMDLGTSYRTKQPVIDEILSRLPNTLRLSAYSMVLATLIGLVTGIVSATKQYSKMDVTATGVALFGVSMPPFWLGLMLILVFSVKLRLLPSAGIDTWKAWIMPTITLGTCVAGIIMRQTRSSMLEVMRQDYIRTARSKGQKEITVIMKHAFRNALMPIVTVIGMQFGSLLAGAVLTETIFSISGLGKYMVDSIKNKDFPAVQGTVLFVAFMCTLINLLIDIFYTFIDPRIRTQFAAKAGVPFKRKKVDSHG